MITGSGGFIGSHLVPALASGEEFDTRQVDITSLDAIRELPPEWQPRTVVHLAGKGTVLTPVAAVPNLFNVCIDGLVHLIQEFRPSRVVFASTCSVYGDSPKMGAGPNWKHVNAVSIYGLAKAAAELLLAQWTAEEQGASAIVLRMGNVIGPGGKGLISHLVRHAIKYPDGSVVMQMRGGGRIIRDYVPVEFATQVLKAAVEAEVPSGTTETYNVGSGRPLTNGHVASVVQQWLAARGYKLNIRFSEEAGRGEAWRAVLKVNSTTRRFRIPPPSVEEVEESIAASTKEILDRLLEEERRSLLSV